MQYGFVFEMALLGFLQREYPELKVTKPSDYLDKKYSIDFFFQVGNYRHPMGISINSFCPMLTDAQRTFRDDKFKCCIHVWFKGVNHSCSDMDVKLMFDNLGDFLVNDYPELTSKKGVYGAHFVTVDVDGIVSVEFTHYNTIVKLNTEHPGAEWDTDRD